MKIFTSRYAQLGLALIVAVLLLVGLSHSAAAAGPVYHTVQPGQTLYSIAAWYGTSVWAIACANGLYNPNYVYAGQVLLIPSGWNQGCQPAHKPMPYPNPQPTKYHPYPQPKPLGCFYTVRWGDHLYRIALKYGVSWTVIAQANGLYNGNYIYAGQVLRVPCGVW
jgi:LysM repeat protein